MYRVAFDPNLPVVAAQPFPAAGRRFAAKDPVDWRALPGVTEQILFQWWQAGLVTFVEVPRVEAQQDAVQASEPVVLEQMLPGIASHDTASKLTRAERRAQRRQE